MPKPTTYEIYNGLIPEMRKEGHSLRAIGDACGGISRERVRQIINQFYPGTQALMLNEAQASKMLGFRLEVLRKKNLITPTKSFSWGLRKLNRYYDKTTLEKAMLIYYSHSCPMCKKAVPSYRTYCLECAEIRHRNFWPFRSPEQKKKAAIFGKRWREAHPERHREIENKAQEKYHRRVRQEHFATTTYIVVRQKAVLPIGTKFQAIGGRCGYLLLEDKSEIQCACVKRC